MKKRLTKFCEHNKEYITPYCDTQSCNGICLECNYEQVIVNKLAAYENTDLQPSEVVELQKENGQLEQQIEELKECICVLTNGRTSGKTSGKTVATKVLNYDLLVKTNEQLKQQLAEKEELLKNAIIVKFDIGDEVFYIDNQYVNGPQIGSNIIGGLSFNNRLENKVVYRFSGCKTWYYDDSLFATKEEAQKKLEELR